MEIRRTNRRGNGGARRGGLAAQRGASLIEVMVVLVILLIGIFLVIRIFPAGFGVLQANGNRSIAVRLADNLLNGVNGDAANLPDGVVFAYQNGNNGLRFATDIDPDRLTTFDPAAATIPARENGTAYNPYFSDINRFRYIKGEGLKVPAPTVNATTGFAAGSIYTCKFGPLYMDNTVGNPANAPNPTDLANRAYYNSYLHVYGAPMAGVSVSAADVSAANAPGYFRSPQVYLIDYGDQGEDAQIMFAPRAPAGRVNPNRLFNVSLTYFDDANNRSVSVTLPVTVPDSAGPAWQRIPNGATNVQHVVAGSDTVTRDFDRLASNTAWDTNDPYQYKLASPNVDTEGGVAGDNWANVGVLLFNPAGANYGEATGGSGSAAFRAYLDYMVLDWHIIHEDREVPNALSGPANSVPIRTTLSFIKRNGDAESDGAFYSGLYGGASGNDIEIYNLSDPTGLPLPQGRWNGGNVNPAGAAYWVDDSDRGGTYRTGTIYLNKGVLAPGTKLRILYKAQGDWGVALQKAYARYTQGVAVGSAAPAPYPLPGAYDKFGVSSPAAPASAQIRLPFQDFNKSFVVGIQYHTRDGAVHRVPAVQMTANQQSTQPDGNYDSRFAFIDVLQFLPARAANEMRNDADSWQVIQLNGVSAKTRVIWRDNDSVTDPWRVQDIDTYLTQTR